VSPNPTGRAAFQSFSARDGRTLSYRLEGTGPLVVMLAGGPGLDPPSFFAQCELPGFQQLVFCSRGTGVSDCPGSPEGYRIAGYIDDVDELRRHLDVEQLTLYGSSHGASITLAYAGSHPDRIERMVLASGPARMDGNFAQSLDSARERFRTAAPEGAERLAASDEAGSHLRTVTSHEDRRRCLRIMMDCYVAHPGPSETAYLDELCAAPMNFAAAGPMGQEMMGGLDLLRHAHHISARTLVLTGELDARVPTEHIQQIAAAVPGAQLVRFPDAGHLIHVESRQQWTQTIGEFLR